jgi:hypothetical protein
MHGVIVLSHERLAPLQIARLRCAHLMIICCVEHNCVTTYLDYDGQLCKNTAGLPLSASCTNASATAWLSPSSSVKRSLLQSQLAPRRRSWLVMKPPYLHSMAQHSTA